MMFKTLREWIGGGPQTRPVVASAASPITYTDATVDRLRLLEQQRTDTGRALACEQAAWDRVKEQADPAAHQGRTVMAPRIIELEAGVSRLSAEIAHVEEAMRGNAARAGDYAQAVADSEAWLTPLLHQLPSDADLERAYRASRDLDHRASELLRGTGDRRFRRAAVDPYSALRDALSDRLRVLDRLAVAPAVPAAQEGRLVRPRGDRVLCTRH
jgi:hypothetical protein